MESVTIEDVCKKDFEVFCDLWGYDKAIDENGFYSSSLTDRLFTSFCAGWRDSRKALVVELPKAEDDNWGCLPYERGMIDGMNAMREDCMTALDATGISYK